MNIHHHSKIAKHLTLGILILSVLGLMIAACVPSSFAPIPRDRGFVAPPVFTCAPPDNETVGVTVTEPDLRIIEDAGWTVGEELGYAEPVLFDCQFHEMKGAGGKLIAACRLGATVPPIASNFGREVSAGYCQAGDCTQSKNIHFCKFSSGP